MINGIEIPLLLSLFGVAMVAGFFDAIAGGGGLITLPALFITGINPISAIATNKLQAYAATQSATFVFAKKKMINWRLGIPIAIMAALGSFSGANCLSLLPTSALNTLIPILLILVACYFAFSSKINEIGGKSKVSPLVFTITIAPLLGFYDGMFGPGVGSFIMVGFISLLGFGITKAVAHTKLINAMSNLGALIVFATQGMIIWSIALSMALGAVIGAQIGAKYTIYFGSRLIRPMLITICLLMALRLLFNTEFMLLYSV